MPKSTGVGERNLVWSLDRTSEGTKINAHSGHATNGIGYNRRFWPSFQRHYVRGLSLPSLRWGGGRHKKEKNSNGKGALLPYSL